MKKSFLLLTLLVLTACQIGTPIETPTNTPVPTRPTTTPVPTDTPLPLPPPPTAEPEPPLPTPTEPDLPFPTPTLEPSPDPTEVPEPTAVPTANPTSTFHEIQPGDTLWSLSERYYANGQLYYILCEANDLWPNCDLIHPGNWLWVPRLFD